MTVKFCPFLMRITASLTAHRGAMLAYYLESAGVNKLGLKVLTLQQSAAAGCLHGGGQYHHSP